MTGNVTLDIHSSHKAPGQAPQEMRSTAAGACFVKNEKLHIVYDDHQEGGSEVIKNHLTLAPEQVELKQKGAIRSKMIFAENERHETSYLTPYGQIPLVIRTNALEVEGLEGDDGRIRIMIAYQMESGGSQMTECQMEIIVREA